ncbi:PID-CTERM protein-sorting domain-containing protein [uncultured Lutibacter sp.]|uniref:PID-CTERM protein-sorting domain-containing protein n=1 Tax=uncultured Lutibacter sp. TaxID=437739 RepID=UPI00261D3076|nr:hypothetical protein [uncultured Lutibacter sp.]
MYRTPIRYYISLLLVFTCFNVFANKIPPFPKSNDGQPGLPIDGGLSMLLISGVAFGVYSLLKKK